MANSTNLDEHPDIILRQQWIQLQRLLYCMEKPRSHDTYEQQLQPVSWRSLLFRAQQCQALWQDILQHLDDRGEATALGSIGINVTVTAQRVDQACRKDFVQAELVKPSQGDLIDRIFFRVKEEEELQPEDEIDDTAEDIYGDLLDTNEDGKNLPEERSQQSRPYHPPAFAAATTATTGTPNIADLQKAQREQMEDAIAAMAERMKEATQGIQQQLQQQTTQTLSELEQVAEQNVVDITRVARDVQQHNQKQRARNWATWTLIFTVVGVFCFCLATIFTIPKRPNTCLIFCGHDQVSLVGWLVKPLKVISKYTIEPVYSLWQVHSDDEEDEDNSLPAETWEDIYHGSDAEIAQKEKLDELLMSLYNNKEQIEPVKNQEKRQVDWRDALKEEEEDEEQDEDDDPFGGRKPVGKKSEGDDDPFGGRKPVRKISESEGDDDLFGGKKPRKTLELERDDDPFGGRKPVEKSSKSQEDDNSFGEKKVVNKPSALQDEDDNLSGGRKPVEERFAPDDDDSLFGDRKPVEKAVESQVDDADPSGAQKSLKRRFAKPVDLSQPPKGVDELAEDTPLGNRKPLVKEEVFSIESKEIFPDGHDEKVPKQQVPKVPETVQDVDMNELFASLKRAAQKTKEEDLLNANVFGSSEPFDGSLPASDGVRGGGPDPESKLRITPRDVRAAAEKGDGVKLREALELQPGYVDRQDKNKWTALHLAARSGRTETIQILHDYGASLTIENQRGMTPLDEAVAHLGLEHPAVKLLRNLAGTVDGNIDGEGDISSCDDPLLAVNENESGMDQNNSRKTSRELLLSLIETLEEPLELDSYVQAGRRRLENAVDEKGMAFDERKAVPDDDQLGLDLIEYAKLGRSRLDAYLGSSEVEL